MTAPDSMSPPPLARPGFDRAAGERLTPGLVDALKADAETRVLVITGDSAPLAAPDALLWRAPRRRPRGRRMGLSRKAR